MQERVWSELLERLMSSELREQLDALSIKDAGHGYDTFGLNKEWVRAWMTLLRPIYEIWFRVTSHGASNIPTEGGAILASNHSGTLPIDGAIIYMDVIRNTHPPRIPRAIVDYFVPSLPFISTFFARMGVVGGSRGNVERLLQEGEIIQVFPEGVPGIRKPFSQRYQLQAWRVGHIEMAIRYRVPVVPMAVIGAEEQMPTLAQLPIRLFGAPYLPIFFPPLPLPVHYHLYYGRPIDFSSRYPAEAADDPTILESCAAEVKLAVAGLIQRGLHERSGIFA